MTKQEHLAEAEHYEMLATLSECEQSLATANVSRFYRYKASKHREAAKVASTEPNKGDF